MIELNKQYYNNNCFFFLKENEDSVTLYYNMAETLMEAKKKISKKEFDKKELPKIKRAIHSFLHSKKKKTKKELEELVNTDGTLSRSKIPYLDKGLHPRKTTDQTIPAARVSNDPVTRGYRVYWGESEDKGEDVVSEVDYSDAFGYDETKDKDYKETIKTLKKMGVENPDERAKEFGKIKGAKKEKGKLRQRLSENDKDMITKTPRSASPFIVKSLGNIKKLAEKEGVGINELIEILKGGE
jgi:hypothetical protein